MKVSELIELLSRYDRDDDVTFYYLKNNVLTNCQFEDLAFYGDMGVEFTIQDTYDGIETVMFQENFMNSTKLTPQQLGDLKREFANLYIGDMTPKELFEFAIHRVTCDLAMMKQEELKDHIEEYDEYAYEILEDYVADRVDSYEIYQEFINERQTINWEIDL